MEKTENIQKTVLKKFEVLNTAIKLFGLLALLTGVFGLGFQKGVIKSTGLGNLNGNYDVKEIFDSAIQGGLHAWNMVDTTNILGGWQAFTVLFVVALLLFAYLGVSLFLVDGTDNKSIARLAQSIFGKEKLSIKNYSIFSIVTSLLLATLAYFSSIIAKVVFKTALLLLLLFPLLGYWAGETWVSESLPNDPCGAITEKMKENKVIRQCTQFFFEGKQKLMGRVILENTDGYIIKRNESFLYYSKDGKKCFYSKYIVTKEKKYDISKGIDFELVDPDITQFCTRNEVQKK
ncbi:MAG: hypothetical protein ACRBHB_09700 [Arenicella sp.]